MPRRPNSFEYAREQLCITPAIYGQHAATSGATDLSGALLLAVGPWSSSVQSDPNISGSGFLLHNTHSRPICFEDANIPTTAGRSPIRFLLDYPVLYRDFTPASDYSGGPNAGSFEVAYIKLPTANSQGLSFDTDVLTFQWAPTLIQSPAPANDSAGWTAPFLYEDRKNVLYATVSMSGPDAPATDAEGFGIAPAAISARPLPKGLPLLTGSGSNRPSQVK